MNQHQNKNKQINKIKNYILPMLFKNTISYKKHKQRVKLQKIREHLNSSLGLNLSEKSVRYLYTPPGEEDG